jgi:hypothetical protein
MRAARERSPLVSMERASAGLRRRLLDLWRRARGGAPAPAAPADPRALDVAGRARPGPARRAGSAPGAPVAARFCLAIERAAAHLVALGDRITLGRQGLARSDLPFRADLGALHAVLERSLTLHHGSLWHLAPQPGSSVEVGGRELDAHGLWLADGDEIRCGPELLLAFRAPDPASDTVVLDVLRGPACAGAAHVVLFGSGEGGRLRIGSAGSCHVQLPLPVAEVELVQAAGRLRVRCAASLRSGAVLGRGSLELPCPPLERCEVAVGAADDGAGAAFAFVLEPLELPDPAGGVAP